MKIRRNDPCWCGSGQKYKRCHLLRSRQEPVKTSEINDDHKRAFGKQYCMHPDSPMGCAGGIVKAHGVQKTQLARIARDGHVYAFRPQTSALMKGEMIEPSLLGISKASVFTGFCGYHDHHVFAPIEERPIDAIPQHIFLLGYRAFAREVYTKKAAVESEDFARNMDRGSGLAHQIRVQDFVGSFFGGSRSSYAHQLRQKARLDTILTTSDYTDLRHFSILLDRCPTVMCSGAMYPEMDCQGRPLQDLRDLKVELEMISFSLVGAAAGGMASFAWLRGARGICERFVESVAALSDDEIPHFLLRFIFECFENTYFSPQWWESLPEPTRKALTIRFNRSAHIFYEASANALGEDGVRAVDWCVQERHAT